MVRFLGGLLGGEFSVVAATDGEEGLRLTREHHPDLIVTDVQMPGMNGFELVERLKADPASSTIPIIMLTARGSLEDRVAGREGGADAYISKPFQSSELRAAVRGLLDQSEVRQLLARKIREESVVALARGITTEVFGPLERLARTVDDLLGRVDPLLNEETPGPAVRRALAQQMVDSGRAVRNGVARIRAAVEELQRFAVGNDLMHAAPVQIDDIVREAVAGVRILAKGREVRTRLGSRAEMLLPRGQIEQVLGHMLANAVQATAEGGGVEIRTWDEPDEVVIEISDEGPGIPWADSERVFEPFYSTRFEGEGRGMGLALSRSIVRSCGGSITLDKEHPVGARFWIRLPLEPEHEEEPPPPPSDGVPGFPRALLR